MLAPTPPLGPDAIERFLLEELPALGPPPRGEAGLARAARFMAMLGDPQDAARQVHVVGTAGKGTAVAAIVARLVGAEARTGSHMSPHVYDLRERFLVDGRLPDWEDVAAALDRAWPAVTRLTQEEGRPPSFFELTTALAWLIGVDADATHLVTEAGIGGMFDATNTIGRDDKVTVVMPIGYDHLEILGHDLASIAENKADVIPRGGVVVMAPQRHEAAAEIVRRTCRERSAHLVEIEDAAASWPDQAAAVADRVAEVLDLATDGGLAPVHLPGRSERIELDGRSVVLDGAHNPMKLHALVSQLAEPPSVLLATLSAEKDLEACARELAAAAPVVIASDFAVKAGERVVRRSWPAVELASALKAADPDLEVHVVPGLERAVEQALDLLGHGGHLLATGSFMMLDPVRNRLTS